MTLSRITNFVWALRYSRRLRRGQGGHIRHAWRYATRIAPANAKKDRVKYR